MTVMLGSSFILSNYRHFTDVLNLEIQLPYSFQLSYSFCYMQQKQTGIL